MFILSIVWFNLILINVESYHTINNSAYLLSEFIFVLESFGNAAQHTIDYTIHTSTSKKLLVVLKVVFDLKNRCMI